MRTLAAVFVGGALGLVILKLLLGLFGSLLATLFGVVALAVKLLLVAAVVWFIWVLVRGRRREGQGAV